MNTVLAKFLSAVFVPLVIPTLAALLSVWANPFAFGGWEFGLFFIIQIAVWTLFIPAFSLFLMKKLDFVSGLALDEQQERIIPYFLLITCFSIAFYAIFKLPIPTVGKAIIMGSIISVILSFFWNNFMKVSGHANGMGTLLGACIGVLAISTRNIEWIIIFVILLSGLVSSARIYLGKHTVKEVMYGYAIGLITQIIAFMIFGVFQTIGI